jgi:hypothetical protein
VPKTFGVIYDHSIFRVFEKRDISKLREYHYRAQADYIQDPTSIFATRYEMYWMLNYDIIYEENGPFNPRGVIPVMLEQDIDILQSCASNPDNVFTGEEAYKNIWLKYFRGQDIDDSDLDLLDDLDYTPTWRLFYDLLWLIFCLDYYTNKLLN